MAIAYTGQMLIERVRRHLANDFPNSSFAISENEVLLYINAAIPIVMKGQMYENAKVVSIFDVPEAYLVTYNITISTLNAQTGEWAVTLPQTPLALPDGYNITDAYFSSAGKRTLSVFFIKTKRASYRELLPKPAGVFARVEGDKVYLQTTEGQQVLLFDQTFCIQMPVSRITDKTAVMNIPDDAIDGIFMNVVAKCKERYMMPQDIIKDDLPSGNKSS